MKAKEFDPKTMVQPAVGEDLKVEDKFLEQFHENDDGRFGNPIATQDNQMRLAFRVGMAWARIEKENT